LFRKLEIKVTVASVANHYLLHSSALCRRVESISSKEQHVAWGKRDELGRIAQGNKVHGAKPDEA
jgi:hypothetical protein